MKKWIKQVHDVFNEYNLNKPNGEILLNQLYYKEVKWLDQFTLLYALA